MSEKSDAILVADILDGHREAFSELVRRHQHYAYGTAMGVLADFELAQDVLQEAFLAAYQDIDNLREPAKFGGWLRGIVRHMAHRVLREKGRTRTLATELSQEVETHDSAPLPDQSLEAVQQRQIVQDALEQLAENNREVVSLHYVEQLSYAEIAAFLGVSETAVQGRLQRARAALRKNLNMVEKHFKENRLKENFAADIQRLLDTITTDKDGRRAAFRQLADLGEPAVAPLRTALEDEREDVRRAAAVALCALGDERGLQPVLDLLYTPGWEPSPSHLQQALEIPGMRPALLQAARNNDERQRWMALRALATAEEGDEEICTCFSAVFRNTALDLRSRIYALRGYCKLCPQNTAEIISAALTDREAQIVDQALRLASRSLSRPDLNACKAAFANTPYGESRRRAALLLHQHGQEGEKILQNFAQQGSTEERTIASLLLAQQGKSEAFVALLHHFLDGQEEEVDTWISQCETATERLPDVFWKHLDRHFEHLAPLVEGLFHGGAPVVRTAAVRLLAQRRGVDFLPELRRCLSGDPPQNAKVAQEAFKQILRLKDAALPTVEEMLEAEDWAQRKAAVGLLRRWDKLTPELQRRVATDPHIAVRRAAGGQ